ncbi:MAG: metallophosphoesterase family protein [Candidatus Kariarchaeaceae archaeon]
MFPAEQAELPTDKFAIIADIHGNLPAFEKVLEHIKKRKIKDIICLGDIVGYYTYPKECLDLVKEHCSLVVQGNHDAAVAGDPFLIRQFNAKAKKVIHWTKNQLSNEDLEYLRKLTLVYEVETPSTNFTMVHGSPEKPFEYLVIRPDNREWILNWAFSHTKNTHLFVGHTHTPKIEVVSGTKLGDRLFINPGSIGQPRDKDPRASYAIVDLLRFEAEIVRVEYKHSVTSSHLLKQGLPETLAHRLSMGI